MLIKLRFLMIDYIQYVVVNAISAVPTSNGVVRQDRPCSDKEKASTYFNIAYSSIKTLTYERSSSPRYAAALLAWPLIFTNEKRHYLTIQYTGVNGPAFVIVQLDKSNFQSALAAAESETGLTVKRITDE